MRKLWAFAFYFLLFAAIASMMPFLVLYYQDRGFTGAQIGALTGIVPLVTLVSAPLGTGIADATRRRRLVMSLALLAGGMTVFAFPFLHAFVPVLLLACLLFVFVAPVMPLADSATLSMLGDEKEMYSRIRLGGTLGFGLAAPLVGLLVQDYGLRAAFWGCGILLLLALGASQKLVYGGSETEGLTGGRVRSLLADPRWPLFLVVALTGGAGLAAFNNYLFPYLEELGASESTMGLALTVGTLAEIPILFFGNRLMRRFGPPGLLMMSMGATGLRCLLLAACATPDLVLVIQLLNGLTFSTMWVAGVSYASDNAPPGMRTTAQGLFNAMVNGVGMAVGGFAGGPLLESIGGHGLFLVFGLAVLAVAALVALLQRRLPTPAPRGG